jgi:hypothetical protein
LSPRPRTGGTHARSHLALVPPGASAEEAAAIAAALEQFTRDTAPPLAAPATEADRWVQAALQEGVERDPAEVLADPWRNT